MNCSTCRFELSQCLDGRLPSGRRAIVMQHASECSDCDTFWAELQAAQRLTLQLRRPRIGPDFRDALWARIQAGEGTPDAVFHEPVPLVVKLRYALTGAAAAAAALLCAMWLAPDDGAPIRQPVAMQHQGAGTEPAPSLGAPQFPAPAAVAGVGAAGPHQDAPSAADAPLIAATQRLGFQLVALETAKQLEQRYTGTTAALHRLANGAAAPDSVVRNVLENAEEFRDLGELLLDLCDRQRLVFIDDKVESDLRFAVYMLAQTGRASHGSDVVKTFVEPALDSSRLASISRKIFLPPLEPGEEQHLLARMSFERPGLFPRLFVIAGSSEPLAARGGVFRFEGFGADPWCDTVFVTPRSTAEHYTARSRARGAQPQVQVHIRREQPR